MTTFVCCRQTPDTLQNLCLELATLGDLKLCERPRNYNLGPFDSKRIRANIKVSSTETGIIFGNIVYDVAGQATTLNADKNCVILNDIHIDIMDYISPAQCTHVDFRNMWSEFEWENKVVVNTEIRYDEMRACACVCGGGSVCGLTVCVCCRVSCGLKKGCK